ncbi:MAG: hypothetical protein K6A80_06730 [Saccharofermentans sp.]|nr:hypothetical protein [Saccharofermentans sp.]
MKNITISLIMIMVVLLSGCHFGDNEPDIFYHDGVKELEEYILSDLGGYIVFSQPEYNSFSSLKCENDDEVVVWHIEFTHQYIYNESEVSSYPPGQIIADFRDLYNSFMADHPYYDLSNYNVIVSVIIPAKQDDDYPPSTICGYLTTYDYESWNHKNNQLICVSLPDEYWMHFYDKSDIEIADMSENSFEQIVEVSDRMSQLNKIIVSNQQMADDLSVIRPNVLYVSAVE